MVELISTGHLNTNIPIYIYGVIRVKRSLFVYMDTLPEQIAIIELFTKFKIFPDCACSQGANCPRDII